MSDHNRIVDAHQHVNWHHRDATALVEDMDEHGIAYAWLLSWLTDAHDTVAKATFLNPANGRTDGWIEGISLQEIIWAREQFPNRFVAGYCPNPQQPQAPELLEAAYHMHHVRICGEWKFRMLFDDPRSLEIFKMAGRLRIPVVLHLDTAYLPGEDGKPVYQPTWYGGTIDNLRRALEACPETVFIGHAPAFWREISANCDTDSSPYPEGPIKEPGRLNELFESFPNLRADLSAGSALRALRRDPEHAKRFLTRFADRLLFGRDYYGGQLFQFLQSLELAHGTLEKIYWKNAESLVPPPPTKPSRPELMTF